MSEAIEHKGQVVSVGSDGVRVRILQASACSACQAKRSCMAADSQEKYIDCVASEPLAVGQSVVVEVAERLGWFAVLLAFVLPFLLLVFMLWLMGRYFTESVAGTVALCSLLPYYFVIWLLRAKLKKRFRFVARSSETV